MATIPIDESMAVSVSLERDLAQIKPTYGCHVAAMQQPQFLNTLCRERKRSERSRRPLLLLQISAAKNSKRGGRTLLKSLTPAIAVSIRETDVLGWYEKGRSLGVLFTEIGVADENVPLIVGKLRAAMRAAIGEARFELLDLTFRIFPDGEASCTGNGCSSNLDFYPDALGRLRPRRLSRFFKRCIDIAGSLCLLVLFLPLFLLVAVLIKLTSAGPVLFRQQRIGRYGESFTFLKFRSMYSNNDSRIHQEYVAQLIEGNGQRSRSGDGSGVYKLIDDPRVTPLGRFLRRTSLDELPQLFNVLLGQMSLVGPRPPVRYEYEKYSLWHRRRVIEVKPGITGLWQVLGRSKTTFDDMVRLDLTYAKEWSIWMDAKILCKTPIAVVRADGAY